MSETPLEIGMLLYPAFTMLDLAGPLNVFAMHANVHLLAKTMEPVVSDTAGAAIVPTATLAHCPQRLDVLFVPGGFGTGAAMRDPEILAFLKDAGSRADYVTSVCTGSFLLGAAGLLTGYKVTTHWAVHDLLATVGAVPVKARVVEDRNRFSGGGVAAGIDFGLTLLAKLRGVEAAQAAQLMLEYDPQPPFNAGSPDTAPAAIVELARKMIQTAPSVSMAPEAAR
jgi:cyclohexyl-isocyanide hydratase